MESKKEKNGILLSLSNDEALVFFEWITRYNQNDAEKMKEARGIHDQAEERVLWDMECCLEVLLVELFKSNYDEHLEKARNNIRDIE